MRDNAHVSAGINSMTDLRSEFSLGDAAATEALGAALARAYLATGRGAGVLYLHGELGTGKTTCVRSLLRTLGVTGSIRSPTYTLVEVYELPDLACVHVDLYRLRGAVDVEELGLRDYLTGNHLLLVEWPERGATALPQADLGIMLSYHEEVRRVLLCGRSERGLKLLDALENDSRFISYVSNIT